jgi:hypothetical protein
MIMDLKERWKLYEYRFWVDSDRIQAALRRQLQVGGAFDWQRNEFQDNCLLSWRRRIIQLTADIRWHKARVLDQSMTVHGGSYGTKVIRRPAVLVHILWKTIEHW